MILRKRLTASHGKFLWLFAASAIFIGASTVPAQAGFEWTPPAKHVAPPVVAAPAPAVDVESLSSPAPMSPFDDEDMSAPSLPSMTPVEAEKIVVPVVMQDSYKPAPAAVMKASARPVPTPAADPVFYEEASGFGSDIPLVLAMQQIVPADYSYSFDSGINPGVRVSWNGGKPWNQVLDAALASSNMHAVISGNTVWIRESWGVTEDKTRVSGMTPPAEPLMVPEPAPVFMMEETVPVVKAPVSAKSVAVTQPPAAEMLPQSYPRRNPVPFRAQSGLGQSAAVSTAPETYDFDAMEDEEPTPMTSSYVPTPVMPSPFAESIAMAPPPVAPPAPAEPIDARRINPIPMSPSSPASGVGSAPMAPPLALNAAQPPAPLERPAMAGGKVMDPFEIRFWHAEQGDSLRTVLGEWADVAEVAMLWDTATDYSLPQPVRMHGTFPDAVTHILMTYQNAEPRPLGRLHPNLPNGPSVLVVENYTSATN